jgi:cell division protease FtsH
MHDTLGHMVYEKERSNYLGQTAPQFDKPYAEETAREIDLAVRAIVQDAYRRTLDILRARETLLRASARDLLVRETFGEEELADIRRQACGEQAAA